MKSRLLGAVCTFAFAFTVSHASAALLTYEYTGNPYTVFQDDVRVSGSYTTSMFLTIRVTIDELGANGSFNGVPVSYSANDGRQTINSPQEVEIFRLTTDSNGNIDTWQFTIADWLFFGDPLGTTRAQLGSTTISDQVSYIQCVTETFDPILGCVGGFSEYASNSSAGTWSEVPIPAAFSLFGSGLLGLVGIARRRKAT